MINKKVLRRIEYGGIDDSLRIGSADKRGRLPRPQIS